MTQIKSLYNYDVSKHLQEKNFDSKIKGKIKGKNFKGKNVIQSKVKFT